MILKLSVELDKLLNLFPQAKATKAQLEARIGELHNAIEIEKVAG